MQYATLSLPPPILNVYAERITKLNSVPQLSDFPVAWSRFVGGLQTEGLAFEFLGGTYMVIVFGLLQSSSLAANPVCTFLGITCAIASVFSVAYKPVFRSIMSRMSDPWRGLAWVQASMDIPTSSWNSAPRLLAVPAVWLAWATVALIAFLLYEAWAGLRDVSSTTPSSPRLNILLSVFITIELLVGLVQAVYVVPAFAKLCEPGGHASTLDGQRGEPEVV
ncbi:uncharacterized protein B0H18DRAFT_382079 [Fomitopsis serialis]|uniref:uncharacterized protein n=1 Tax=Fomitopsis serialis TaxID=139415 RepID=UPI002007517B|nr:uncharacterized protein B0H18DRAFT_382079 [Neoantrodia serialis]KAH9925257.1 hypothetical protein B0H18DRAFT_382079 [Neoantrodia serialis]